MENFKKSLEEYPEQFAVIVVTVSGCRVFNTFAEAKKTYPELDMYQNTEKYTWAMFGGWNRELAKYMMRFEDWEINNQLSM